MRSSSSSHHPQQQKNKKDFSVFEFNEADASVEIASVKFKSRRNIIRSNPKEQEPLTKYQFLQAFGGLTVKETDGPGIDGGLNFKQTDGTGISCIDVDENGSPRGSFTIDSPERNFAYTEEISEVDEIMASSTSYDERGNMCLSGDPETCVRVEPLMTGATSLVVPSVGNELVSEFESDGAPVDVISDEEESCTSGSISPSTSASDLAEDEDCPEYPDSDNCYTAFGEKYKDELSVIVSPDFVIYGNTLYEETQLVFYSDSIKVECLNASGNDEHFVLEWEVADIIHIECQWSGSVEAALVKFHLRATTVNVNEKIRDICDVVKLIFSVAGMHWLEKEQRIKSLAERYKDIWNDLRNDDLVLEDDLLERNMFFPRYYFTEVPDTFEDVIYPKGDPDAVSISRRDFELLQPDTFINDTIIDFYIKYLKSRIPPNERHRFHFFNSFFFRKLVDLDKDPGSATEGRAAFLRVRKWTRKVNIFEKDYIFIPVNFNLHWSLLVICHAGEVALKEDDIKNSPKVPCILHMDSIKGTHSGLKNLVQSYLWEEWKERHPESAEDYESKFSNLRFVPLELPQQENSFDCGLFLLHYVELFLKDAPANFSPFKITKFSTFLNADWFSPPEASFKRSLIRKLIYGLLNDPSQKASPICCSNGRLSSVYHENDIRQVPAVEFLAEHCSPAKTALGNSTCSPTDRGTEINPVNMSSHGVSQCAKQDGMAMHEFLKPGANSMSSLEPQDHDFQENEPFQMPKCATCPTEELADTSEQIVSSTLDKENGRPVDESPSTQTYSTSYCPKDVGESELHWSSVQENEEIGIDFLPKTLNSNHALSHQSEEIQKPGPVLMEDSAFVPDSPTSSSGENRDSVSGAARELDTSKAEEDESCETSPHGIEDTTGPRGCDDVNYQEINTANAIGEDSDDHQKTEATDADGRIGKDCQVIDTCKAEAEVGENCQIVETNEVDGGDGEDCEEMDTKTEADSRGSCKESLTSQSSQDVLIKDDEKCLVKESARLKRNEPSMRIQLQYQKRQKVLPPEGDRRHTRKYTRDYPV